MTYQFHTPDCDQWSVPSKLIKNKNGVRLTLHSLPYNHTQNKLVYFVSGDNGDEFGQFPNVHEATIKFNLVSELSLKDRHEHDE